MTSSAIEMHDVLTLLAVIDVIVMKVMLVMDRRVFPSVSETIIYHGHFTILRQKINGTYNKMALSEKSIVFEVVDD